jgi:hypothetical protein
MPSTSASWSTLVNAPLDSRHAMIAAAVTGPTPGKSSSCASVALFKSTKPLGAELLSADSGPPVAEDPGSDATELPIVVGSPAGAAMPTMICSPSATLRAMFKPIVRHEVAHNE